MDIDGFCNVNDEMVYKIRRGEKIPASQVGWATFFCCPPIIDRQKGKTSTPPSPNQIKQV